MTTMLAERPFPAAPRSRSLVQTRAERFVALFDAHPEAVVVRREAAGGNVLCVLAFCEEHGCRPLAVWRDAEAVEVALTPAQYDEYLTLMAGLASKRNDWSYLQTVYWKNLDRPQGWCWMQVPAYSA
ncbi:MAG: hypothetical protein R3E35_04580 [Rhodocyclaceae bacterium]|jgi:hypothetical protein